MLDPYLRCEQNGFRQKRGTLAQILAIRRIVEESQTHHVDLVAVFVDFRKAFDSVSRKCIPKVLKAYNVPEKLVNAVCALYKDTTASVLTSDGPTDDFSTTSGVLQGDTLAPFLFILVLDWVLRISLPDDSLGLLLEKRRSSRYLEKRLSLLAYADDLVLLSSNQSDAQTMLTNLARVATKVGLSINTEKTEVLSIPKNDNTRIVCRNHKDELRTLKNCDSFKYLRGLIPNGTDDVQQRLVHLHGALSTV